MVFVQDTPAHFGAYLRPRRVIDFPTTLLCPLDVFLNEGDLCICVGIPMKPEIPIVRLKISHQYTYIFRSRSTVSGSRQAVSAFFQPASWVAECCCWPQLRQQEPALRGEDWVGIAPRELARLVALAGPGEGLTELEEDIRTPAGDTIAMVELESLRKGPA